MPNAGSPAVSFWFLLTHVVVDGISKWNSDIPTSIYRVLTMCVTPVSILTPTLRGTQYCPHFRGEQTKA